MNVNAGEMELFDPSSRGGSNKAAGRKFVRNFVDRRQQQGGDGRIILSCRIRK